MKFDIKLLIMTNVIIILKELIENVQQINRVQQLRPLLMPGSRQPF